MNARSKGKSFIILAIALVAVLTMTSAVLARGISEKPAWELVSGTPRGALIILALDDHGPTLTGQAVAEQIHTFLSECQNGDIGDEDGFATGPDDLFPPAGIEDCPTPGLVSLRGALVILPPHDQGLVLTEQGLVEQIRNFLGECQNGDIGDEDCPTIIRIPYMSQ
jgi:hypothetical protein